VDIVKPVCDSTALMKGGRVVESGTVVELPAPSGSEPADELFPVGGGTDRTLVDLTFYGDSATRPVISRLARTYHVDISILSAAMETYEGRQIGRMRIELPGRFEDNVVPIGFLREQGIGVVILAEPEPDPELAPAPGSALAGTDRP
jgi:D-methionine transport system ATP-binding protein